MNNPNNKDHWFRDFLVYGLSNHFFFLWIIIIAATVATICLPILGRMHKGGDLVIVYTSQDQEYAQRLFESFGRATKVDLREVYDNEAAKTVGLVNRLIAEKNNPQCDVFWNNEELRTRQLARDGIIDSNWVSFGVRTRRIVVNTNLIALAAAPRDVLSLTNHQYFGKVALAYPLFGTTSAHFLALRQYLGATGWENWCRTLAANKPFVVDGNSVVVKMVGRGEAAVGLTDSDDILSGQREGLPVDSVRLGKDGFEIPNTAAMLLKAPHPEAAKKLLDYLQSPEVLRTLQNFGAVEPDNSTAQSSVDWNDLLANQNQNLEFLKGLFLR